ncbi:MAG: phosphoribosyl-ATP diphosphatase [Chloroflexi bacterium]|nr:phosphoribosyl-ATP diphosphatase [Chloroflexota bacterium]
MNESDILSELWAVIRERQGAPSAQSYTSRLFQAGTDEIVKKLGEEAIEVIVAAKGGQTEQVAWEAADLLYHLWVALAQCNVPPEQVYAELRRRRSPRQNGGRP